MAKQKTKTCQGNDCIFCCSVCPECGSNDIDVTFKPVLKYENDETNKIVINYEGGELELNCRECDAWIENTDFESKKRLHPLERAISRELKIPTWLELKHDSKTGKITS